MSTSSSHDNDSSPRPSLPGQSVAMDGSQAVAAVETEASEAAGAYPITPATQMGEGWSQAVAAGKTNAFGRKLLFFEPEGEHAAAGVTAGMSMAGLRAANFSGSQGIAYMHESLYAAVGKRLTYVLNMACRAMTKQALNIHAGHDDYHAIDDTGFFQLFAKNVQEAADLNLIAHRIAELALNPGVMAQDGFLTTHVIESLQLPEPELVRRFLGDPEEEIESPTPAQRKVFGSHRRRIPILYDFDYPALLGSVQNQDSYAQGVAAQRPFYFDHIAELADRAMREYAELTGRQYHRATGYRMDDADYVLIGQGTVVGNAEATADWLRKERGLKVGVLNMTMFRPFPADRVARLLGGKKGVAVLERLDQPLAADAPLLREIRTALSKAHENHRAGQRTSSHPFSLKASADQPSLPYPKLPALAEQDIPDLYSGMFGMGSRDIQPGDLVAAVDNMLPEGQKRRQYYLGIDFVRPDTPFPKLEIQQEELLDDYPDLQGLALDSTEQLDLMPPGAVSLRIHSIGGWGAITTGKNLAMTGFELADLYVKANPKYGSEKKGQPTTFYATLAEEPIRINAELKHVDTVLSPDPNVFGNTDPLLGLKEEGAFVLQSELPPEEVWQELPAHVRQTIREDNLKLYVLDGFAIASDEASDPSLRYRLQGGAFMGAFFRASPLMEKQGIGEEELFEGLRERMKRKFGYLGEKVIEDNVRVIRRGFDELKPVPVPEAQSSGLEDRKLPMASMPPEMEVPAQPVGAGQPGRFYGQVCSLYQQGQEPVADPFAALSAIPAATSALKDMTNIRFEVPEFVPANCTGCSKCWVQCPDSAIPGLVNTPREILESAISRARWEGHTLDRLGQITKHLAREIRNCVEATELEDFGQTVKTAYKNLVPKLGWSPEQQEELDEDFATIFAILKDFPVAKTTPFWDVPERQEEGTGGLLSITVDPEACKGCNICVEVCPDDALRTIRQDEETVEQLRRNWELWEELPDTDDRYINVVDVDEGIGVLSSLLLKKDVYRSMVGGDGACMGCGEKTTTHLVVSAITAAMQSRVDDFVGKLDELIAGLEQKGQNLVSEDLELDLEKLNTDGPIDIPVPADKKETLRHLSRLLEKLKDLRWRYLEGPGGRGRAKLGISNSTGCSSVWGSTYPYNPYPVPWVNHLFQGAPSVAIGIFEGHMRHMADDFANVRMARKMLDDEFDPIEEKAFREDFDHHDFTDEEFLLCPPMLVVGGDGAMLDIGFQNLSRLMASGKPLRVLVLDTQAYSNTGGQACTSGFLGQISDMAEYGRAQHGKTEHRKELGLIALAHRNTYVLQSSQASASHLLEGVLQGLQKRRPAIFNIHTPCPVEHRTSDEWAPQAAKLAQESRAFPHFVYDPDGGTAIADCLELGANPAPDQRWPSYELEYSHPETGESLEMTLPMTIADWAATEGRFRKHFQKLGAVDMAEDQTIPPETTDSEGQDLVLFHEYLELDAGEQDEATPFVYVLEDQDQLTRWAVSDEMVELAEERLHYWSQLQELSGQRVADSIADRIRTQVEEEFQQKQEQLKQQTHEEVARFKHQYARKVARRMAEGLLVAAGQPEQTLEDILEKARNTPNIDLLGPEVLEEASLPEPSEPAGDQPGSAEDESPTEATTPTPDKTVEARSERPQETTEAREAETPESETEDTQAGQTDREQDQDTKTDTIKRDPYIETARCTTCDECININNQLFAYDENKQAYIADPEAGTFKEIVQAAEKCTARIIHPGDPLDEDEPDLEKWIERAKNFQ